MSEQTYYLYRDLGFQICLSPVQPAEWEGECVEVPESFVLRHLHQPPPYTLRFTNRDQSFAALSRRLDRAETV